MSWFLAARGHPLGFKAPFGKRGSGKSRCASHSLAISATTKWQGVSDAIEKHEAQAQQGPLAKKHGVPFPCHTTQKEQAPKTRAKVSGARASTSASFGRLDLESDRTPWKESSPTTARACPLEIPRTGGFPFGFPSKTPNRGYPAKKSTHSNDQQPETNHKQKPTTTKAKTIADAARVARVAKMKA